MSRRFVCRFFFFAFRGGYAFSFRAFPSEEYGCNWGREGDNLSFFSFRFCFFRLDPLQIAALLAGQPRFHLLSSFSILFCRSPRSLVTPGRLTIIGSAHGRQIVCVFTTSCHRGHPPVFLGTPRQRAGHFLLFVNKFNSPDDGISWIRAFFKRTNSPRSP